MMSILQPQRPCVLVFAGHDPSGGAGIQADIEAIAAQGAHALSVITALTVQDNDRVYAVHPVDAALIRTQALSLLKKIPVRAIKFGITGCRENALMLTELVMEIRQQQPQIPVVVDTVLGSGHGDQLSADDAVKAMQILMSCATLVTPNLPELARLAAPFSSVNEQIHRLMQMTSADILLKGGHGNGNLVSNRWYASDGGLQREWLWPRLAGEFHGSGCTLAAALAAQLALDHSLETALNHAQAYTHTCLMRAYEIAGGQKIPGRS